MVHECSDMADFKAQLSAAGSKLVVVDFHATWCGPCKMIAPHIVEVNAIFFFLENDKNIAIHYFFPQIDGWQDG